MSYTENYQQIRNRYRRYLTGRRAQRLLALSQTYNRQNAFNRVAAASALRTGFRQGFNGLRNVGMENSGEVERLKRRLGSEFTYTNDQLNKNEVSALGELADKYKKANIRARNKREQIRQATNNLNTAVNTYKKKPAAHYTGTRYATTR